VTTASLATVFCLDTTAFVEPWVRRYPIDVFPTYWQTLDEWAHDGRVVAPDEVLREIEKNDDDLHKWVKLRAMLFQPVEADVQNAVTAILAEYPRLVDTRKGRHTADPWVIAQAQVMSVVVVTEESEGSRKSPKIPDVCRDKGISVVRVVDLIRAMDLRL
jgi:hypothetical protein